LLRSLYSRVRALKDLHQARARPHRESDSLFHIAYGFKCDTIVLIGSSNVGVRRKDTYPARKTTQVSTHRTVPVIVGNVNRMQWNASLLCHSRISWSGKWNIGCQLYTVLCRVVSDFFNFQVESLPRCGDSSERIPMQLTITLWGRLRMNLSIGPRFRSEVHCLNCADGNRRCSTIWRYHWSVAVEHRLAQQKLAKRDHFACGRVRQYVCF
jgi:hypothetical protein